MPRRRRQRPVVLTVMGIINIVAGGLGLVCSLAGIGTNLFVMSMAKSAGPNNPAMAQINYMNREAPGWQNIEIAHDVLVILISFLLLAAGIGLLMRKNWARWLSLLCAVGIIVLRLAYAVYKATVTIPVLERFQRMNAGAAGATGYRIGGYFGIGAVVAIWLAFSFALCITMLMPSAVEGCAPPRKRRLRDEEDEEPEDELDEDRPLRDADDDFEPPPRPARDPDGDDTRFRDRRD